MLDGEDVVPLMRRLGHDFSDEKLLYRALRHRSAGSTHNERLEFLGDALLNFLIAEMLYAKFGNASEGQLSRLRASLVDKASLVAVAQQLDLSRFIILGAGECRSGGAFRESILADSVEAIIAAVYLDSDLPSCRQCVLSFYRERIDNLSLRKNYKDAKTRLQERLQSFGKPTPVYRLLSVTGKAHEQIFTVSCRCELWREEIIATGSSRRRAEQQAAADMLSQVEA